MVTKKSSAPALKGVVTNVSSDGLEDAVVIVTLADGTEHRQYGKLVDAPAVGDEVTITGDDVR